MSASTGTPAIVDVLITAIDAANLSANQVDAFSAVLQAAIALAEPIDRETATKLGTAKLQVNRDFCSRNQTLNCKRQEATR